MVLPDPEAYFIGGPNISCDVNQEIDGTTGGMAVNTGAARPGSGSSYADALGAAVRL